MQKLILLTFFSFFILSCNEKEKTYEELEAEVLCDVLPEVIPEIGSLFIPPPPPDSLQNENYKISSDEEFFKLVNEEKEKTKKLAKQKYNYRIGVIDTLRGIDFTYYKNEFPKHFNDFKPIFDSLGFRQINKNEVKNSTVPESFVQPVNCTVNVNSFGVTQVVTQVVKSVTELKHHTSIVLGLTFATVVIDQDGPASYPDRPRILVTNNWLDCCKYAFAI